MNHLLTYPTEIKLNAIKNIIQSKLEVLVLFILQKHLRKNILNVNPTSLIFNKIEVLYSLSQQKDKHINSSRIIKLKTTCEFDL